MTKDIDKVSFTNSGRTQLAHDGVTTDLDQLSEQILDVVGRIKVFKGTEIGSKAFKSYIFAPATRLLRQHQLSADERAILELKKELIDLVTEFVIRVRKPEGSTFSQRLLEVYGYEACGICCGKEFDLDPLTK